MVKKIIELRFYLIASAIVALVSYGYSSEQGVGLTHDSLNYLEDARKFSETNSIKSINVNQYLPIQSLLTMVLSISGENRIEVAYYMNGVLLLLSLFVSILLMSELVCTEWVRILYILIISFGTPLILVHSFLWTEPFFIFFLSLFWFSSYHFFEKPSITKFLLMLLTLCFACWSRKAGLIFVASTYLGLTFYFRSNLSLKRLILLIALPLTFLLFLYGKIGSVNFLGELPNLSFFWFQADYHLKGLSRWFVPEVWFLSYLSIGILAFLVLAPFIKIKTFRMKSIKFYQFALIQLLIYLLVRLFFDRPYYDEIERYLAPVYSILFLLLMIILDNINFDKPKMILLKVMVFIWVLYPIGRTIKNVKFWNESNRVQIDSVI